MTALRIWAVVVLCVACGSRPEPQRVADVQRRIQDWLLCDECTDGELAAVTALGAEAVPSLVAALRGGLSPASRAELQQQLAALWDAGSDAPARMSKDEFVALHVGNRDALLRVRSARALGRIGTPEAEGALEAALSVPQRPSAEKSIRDALEEARQPR